MFSFVEDNSIFNTPPKFQPKEKQKTSKVSPDCVSFCGDSDNKFIFDIESFHPNDLDQFKQRDVDFQSKIQQDVDDKIKGIRNILGKLGTSLDRLRGEVDSMIHPDYMTKQLLDNQLKSNLFKDENHNQNKENLDSVITTSVFNTVPLHVLFAQKQIERSCTKSCSKVKSQMKKYQNNGQLQSYKTLLKEITFSESNKKTQVENQFSNVEKQSYNINARRKLDFDFFKDEQFPEVESPKSKDEYDVENNLSKITSYDQQEKDQDVQFPRKIFVKDIQKQNNNVKYYFIYRTHH